MRVFGETMLALFAAGGFFALAWLLFGRLLTPVGGALRGPVYLVVPARGDAAGLEQTVRGLLWLRGAGLADFTIVVADLGLDSAGCALAELMARGDAGVVTCRPEELDEYIAGR